MSSQLWIRTTDGTEQKNESVELTNEQVLVLDEKSGQEDGLAQGCQVFPFGPM